jgi:chromosomal replication initiator protein
MTELWRNQDQPVLAAVAEQHGTTVERLLLKSRAREHVWPRQAVMVTLREQHDWTLSRIGRVFGCDHTTVLYSVRAAKDRAEWRRKVRG